MPLQLTDNANIVLERRYLKKNDQGEAAETPEALFDRVARSIAGTDAFFDPQADVEKTRREFYDMMTRLWFLPNSPTLMNAGRRLGQLAACFVLPVDDSMESIFETLKHAAIIHKSGGGTGFSFSRIRPASDVVLSTAGVSSGPISFMTVYDVATETVKQGGTRRGANMGVLRVDHPDIEAFIASKNDLQKLNNFNISVALTRAFMTALKEDGEYALINPRTREAVRRTSARGVFDQIVAASWNTGEPGIVFIDSINDANPTPGLGAIESTNPCGEQPLLPYESCTLGSINLSKMVHENGVGNCRPDMERLRQTVRMAVHFLDNVIEANKYPLNAIEAMSKGNRKIGLGVMGFADMLIKMGIPYDSDAALEQAETLMAFISREARQASAALAEARGNFPNYAESVFDAPDTPRMRNATVTTIAPTGTLSIIAGTSSGIEPVFALAHARKVLDGRTLHEIHPLFLQAAREGGFYSKGLEEEVIQKGAVHDIAMVPERIKRLFVTSHHIAARWHISIQAAFQKHTDNAVSKTINFPETATREDVEDAYLMAHESGCKGVTIYRYGSRGDQVLNLNLGPAPAKGSKIAPRPRPERTFGATQRIRTGCGNLYVTVNSDDKGMCEVFAQMGKTGGCASSQIEAAGRLISLALRSGVKAEAVIKQLVGIRCPSPSWQNGKVALSCPDAIAKVLKGMVDADVVEKPTMMGMCPECGAAVEHEGGCLVCRSCGYSKCV